MKGLYFPDCYALVSGGKDSLTAANVLFEAGKLLGCVALKTGISTPDWESFITKVCADRGWPLEIYETPVSYEEKVLKYGFPGPAKHGWFMNYLKGRCITQFKKKHKGASLASGVRRAESARRKINTLPVSVWEGVPIIAPIYDWTDDEVWEYFYAHGFKRAPAYSTLQISGDCLCGAFAKEGELDAVRFHYPEIGKRFDAITERIKETHPKRCVWGWGNSQKKEKTAKQRMICVECGDTQGNLFEALIHDPRPATRAARVSLIL